MKPAGPLETALQSLEAEFEVVLGKPAVVEAACRTLHDELAAHPDAEQAARLAARLLPLLQKRRGALLPPVVALLSGLARRGADAGAILGGVLELRDETLRETALALLLSLTRDGTLALEGTLLERLAPAIDAALGASPPPLCWSRWRARCAAPCARGTASRSRP